MAAGRNEKHRLTSLWKAFLIHASHTLHILKVIVFSLLVFLMMQAAYSQTQSQSQAKISGRVIDASTEKPLAGVNVFLAGTTRGVATDHEGRYAIENVPFGTYELVASIVGYEAQKTTIRLADVKAKVFHFNLKPEILEGEEVTVTGEVPKEWKKNLKVFEQIFFGITDFAKECKLLNPEVLDFEYDRTKGHFQAVAVKPIIFVNKALGYEVTFLLDHFNAELYDDNLYHFDIRQGSPLSKFKTAGYRCVGTIKFKELVPQNEEEKKKWESNRLVAYNGSVRHFLKSLCTGRLKAEGFEIWGARNFNKNHDYKVKADTLLHQGAISYQRILTFPDFLKVVYKKEKDKISHQIYTEAVMRMKNSDDLTEHEKWVIERDTAYQISWIEITEGRSFTITTDGLIEPGNALPSFYGYWRWDILAEALPTDYEPSQVAN
jgi:hypothetical protein